MDSHRTLMTKPTLPNESETAGERFLREQQTVPGDDPGRLVARLHHRQAASRIDQDARRFEDRKHAPANRDLFERGQTVSVDGPLSFNARETSDQLFVSDDGEMFELILPQDHAEIFRREIVDDDGPSVRCESATKVER